MTEEKKVSYITGALIGLKRNGDVYEAEFHDKDGTFFYRKELGMKVGTGYKIGIIDTDVKNRYEIVSVEQPLLTDPAFKINGPQGKTVQMKEDVYKDLIQAKKIRIRSETLKAAIEICALTEEAPITREIFADRVLKVSRKLEPYFE